MTMDPRKGCAVTVEDFGLSSRVSSLPVGEGMPFDVQEACPACEAKLETCAVLIDGGGKRRLRYGLCASCGYMG